MSCFIYGSIVTGSVLDLVFTFDLSGNYTDTQSMLLLLPPYSKSRLQLVESSADDAWLHLHIYY